MVFRNINLDENAVLKNQLPLLILDENWLKLFGDVRFKNMQALRREINDGLVREGQLQREYNSLQGKKTRAMKMILGVSDAINNEDKDVDPDLLEGYKEEIETTNQRLEEIKIQLEDLPQEIRELNFQLLKLTVDYGYRELKTKEKQLNSTNKELEVLREKLRDLINEKHDHEEWIGATYKFLHGILGSREIEKLDQEYLDRGESLW